MERCLILLVIREVKLKVIMRYILYVIDWLKWNILIKLSVCRDVNGIGNFSCWWKCKLLFLFWEEFGII